MRSFARARSSSRRAPPKAALKPCSSIASSSVTDWSRLREARGPGLLDDAAVVDRVLHEATIRSGAELLDHPVAVLDHLGEVVARVHVHHRERQRGRDGTPCARGAAAPPSPCRPRTAARRARARRRPRGSRGSPRTRGPAGVRSRSSCLVARAASRRAGQHGSYVQSALRLLLPGPTPFAAVAGQGAGGAADGIVPLVVERMVGKIVLVHVAPDVASRPVGERIELPYPARRRPIRPSRRPPGWATARAGCPVIQASTPAAPARARRPCAPQQFEALQGVPFGGVASITSTCRP